MRLSTALKRQNGLVWGGFRADPVDVTHLSAGARLGLAIGVRTQARAEPGGNHPNLVADEVLYDDVGEPGGVAERPAADGADMLLELVGDADGFRPVAGIV